VTERKGILLRLDPAVHDALARCAADELRSTNAQIEFLLRRALAEAGVPASVHWGRICLARGRHVLLSTEGFVKFSPSGTWKDQPGAFFGLVGRGQGGLGWSWTINPAKIPSGAQFMISAIPSDRVPRNDYQAVWEFVPKSAPVACARFMKS